MDKAVILLIEKIDFGKQLNMNLHYKKTRESTHQLCRSLLQKAIRRGNKQIAFQTAQHLYDIGDRAWIRNRIVVICAEECWPFLNDFNYSVDKDEILSTISIMSKLEKNKDAAGLGSLSYALSIGDETVLEDKENNRPIKIIANAIHRPDDYWNWLISISKSKEEEQFVNHLTSLHKKAGWPWDKAFIQSAGFLYINEPTRVVKLIEFNEDKEFPYWIAMDKHTKEGKSAIQDIANYMKLAKQQLAWISFYLESGVTNFSHPSYWWEREKKWRLNKVGISINQAKDIWEEAKPKIIERLRPEVDYLKSHVNIHNNAIQNSLF